MLKWEGGNVGLVAGPLSVSPPLPARAPVQASTVQYTVHVHVQILKLLIN